MITCMESQPETVLAARLKQLMDERGMNSTQLAENSHLSRSAVWKLLHGKSVEVRGESLEKLAKALGTTVDFLQGRTDDPTPSGGEPWPQYALEVLESMRQLDGAQNYTLLVTARALVKESEMLYRLAALNVLQELVDRQGYGTVIDSAQTLIGEIESGRFRRGRRGRGIAADDAEEQPPEE